MNRKYLSKKWIALYSGLALVGAAAVAIPLGVVLGTRSSENASTYEAVSLGNYLTDHEALISQVEGRSEELAAKAKSSSEYQAYLQKLATFKEKITGDLFTRHNTFVTSAEARTKEIENLPLEKELRLWLFYNYLGTLGFINLEKTTQEAVPLAQYFNNRDALQDILKTYASEEVSARAQVSTIYVGYLANLSFKYPTDEALREAFYDIPTRTKEIEALPLEKDLKLWLYDNYLDKIAAPRSHWSSYEFLTLAQYLNDRTKLDQYLADKKPVLTERAKISKVYNDYFSGLEKLKSGDNNAAFNASVLDSKARTSEIQALLLDNDLKLFLFSNYLDLLKQVGDSSK